MIQDERGASLFPNCLLVGVLAGLIGVGVTVWWIEERPQAPQYKAGECFVSNGPRETWEPAADGIIIQVGKAKYLWEPWDLAVKNHGKKPWRRDEYAIPWPIKGLDNMTHRVECPTKEVTYYN